MLCTSSFVFIHLCSLYRPSTLSATQGRSVLCGLKQSSCVLRAFLYIAFYTITHILCHRNFRFFIPCIFYMCYNKNYQQMRLFVLCLYFLFSSFPYMFRAFMGPSSGVFQAVVFMLPFGSCSALLIVCVRQRTGLWW